MANKLKKWDDAYKDADIATATPAQVLLENEYLLPKKGDVLDLACGRGGNALFLARLKSFNLQVDAIDVSPVVLDKLKQYAAQNDLAINCHLRDIESQGLLQKQYDVIVVSYFLDRDLFPAIVSALKPNGLLFYQTWSQEKVDDTGPNNPKFRLASSELLRLTTSLVPLLYRENGAIGNTNKGLRNEAMLIARKV